MLWSFYSGGDDLFIVGSWDDIIGFAVDLYYALKKYTQGTLKISGGIGLYPSKYPISVMAKQTGELERCSKRNDREKCSCCFWSEIYIPLDRIYRNDHWREI